MVGFGTVVLPLTIGAGMTAAVLDRSYLGNCMACVCAGGLLGYTLWASVLTAPDLCGQYKEAPLPLIYQLLPPV